jgi:hypothetical protein
MATMNEEIELTAVFGPDVTALGWAHCFSCGMAIWPGSGPIIRVTSWREIHLHRRCCEELTGGLTKLLGLIPPDTDRAIS